MFTDNAVTGPRYRKAYASSFSLNYDIGLDVWGENENDYYSSIKIQEVYRSIAVRAVRKF